MFYLPPQTCLCVLVSEDKESAQQVFLAIVQLLAEIHPDQTA